MKDLRRLSCKFDLDREFKSLQVNPGARKAWPNGVSSRPFPLGQGALENVACPVFRKED